MAISPAYPNILQNGSPADATQVMADFYQIQNDVNANAASAGANTNITSLTGLTTPLGIAYGGTGTITGIAAGAAPLASPTFTGLITGANAVLTGTLDVSSTLAASGNASVGGGLTVASLLAAAGNVTVGGTLVMTGATTLAAATGVTPAVGDSTTKLATTAFVSPAGSLAANGYLKFASGLIIQWGTTGTIGPGATSSITLPLAFPNNFWAVVPSPQSLGSGTPNQNSAIPSSLSAFNMHNGQAATTQAFMWIAIGN